MNIMFKKHFASEKQNNDVIINGIISEEKLYMEFLKLMKQTLSDCFLIFYTDTHLLNTIF